jgi:hypothetical protein
MAGRSPAAVACGPRSPAPASAPRGRWPTAAARRAAGAHGPCCGALKAGGLVGQIVWWRPGCIWLCLGMRASTPVPTSRTWSCARPLSGKRSSGAAAQGLPWLASSAAASARVAVKQVGLGRVRGLHPRKASQATNATVGCTPPQASQPARLQSGAMQAHKHAVGRDAQLAGTPTRSASSCSTRHHASRRAAPRAGVRCGQGAGQQLALLGPLLWGRGFAGHVAAWRVVVPVFILRPACSSACPALQVGHLVQQDAGEPGAQGAATAKAGACPTARPRTRRAPRPRPVPRVAQLAPGHAQQVFAVLVVQPGNGVHGRIRDSRAVFWAVGAFMGHPSVGWPDCGAAAHGQPHERSQS